MLDPGGLWCWKYILQKGRILLEVSLGCVCFLTSFGGRWLDEENFALESDRRIRRMHLYAVSQLLSLTQNHYTLSKESYYNLQGQLLTLLLEAMQLLD